MSPERYKQVREVFDAALEIPAESRRAFVDQACGSNHELRDEVQRLLDLRSREPGFLQNPEQLLTKALRHESERARRRVARRLSSDDAETSGSYSLAPDLVRKGVLRIGFIGIVCAVMAPLAYVLELRLQPERVLLPGRIPLPLIAAATLFAAGLLIFILERSGRVPARLMLDLGLIFEVIGALAIALSEHATPWPPDLPIRGISWNCLWIALFIVAVPAGYAKSILAAATAACMGPIGFAIATLVNQNPIPAFNQWLILMLPNFAVVAWAIPVARYMHGLRAQVSKQREMGSYRLIERIGRGGMGEVWRAEHRLLARKAVIKLIRPEALRGDEGAESPETIHLRFDREARITAALRSPNTVALYDYGVSDEGAYYYVMELLDGLDLDALVRRDGALTPSRAVYLLQQVCRSLAEAHEAGLVHRDIKPRNLFLCHIGMQYDVIKVLDFGIAKPAGRGDAEVQLTQEGVATGTPAYMAPEVALGAREIDGRADLYSLGCVAYWLLTGRGVFERETGVSMALAHVQSVPPPVSAHSAHPVPAALESLILRCLAKDRASRPASARELHDLLAACDVRPVWSNDDAESWWGARRSNGGDHTTSTAMARRQQ